MEPSRIYVDHGLTGTNRERPGLREALAACRDGDTLLVTKLDRLAHSLPDARAIAEDLTKRKVRLNLGAAMYDPADPVGRLLFNVPAMVAEFEADLIRSRTREGMRVAKAKGHPRGKQPKLNPRQEAHLVELLHTGEYTTSELGDLFGVARSTVYRAVARGTTSTAAASSVNAARAPHRPASMKSTTTPPDATTSYRPRHVAPSEFPSENRAPQRANKSHPEPAPQTGRRASAAPSDRDAP